MSRMTKTLNVKERLRFAFGLVVYAALFVALAWMVRVMFSDSVKSGGGLHRTGNDRHESSSRCCEKHDRKHDRKPTENRRKMDPSRRVANAIGFLSAVFFVVVVFFLIRSVPADSRGWGRCAKFNIANRQHQRPNIRRGKRSQAGRSCTVGVIEQHQTVRAGAVNCDRCR